MNRVLSLILLSFAATAHAQEALFVVRHAEKADDAKDPPLSAAGQARAKALAALLRDAGVTAVVSSEFVRTRATAEPLASALKLAPEVQPAKDTAALARWLKREHPRGRVLVVGHSNTVPELLAAYGATGKLTLAEKDYDNLFVLVPHENGPPTVIRLRY